VLQEQPAPGETLVKTPFLKKKRREAEVRMALSRQKNNINILADKAGWGFI
jgi:hypothetical protein